MDYDDDNHNIYLDIQANPKPTKQVECDERDADGGRQGEEQDHCHVQPQTEPGNRPHLCQTEQAHQPDRRLVLNVMFPCLLLVREKI